MAKSKGVRPVIAGGRTLAVMRRGKGQDGGGKQRRKKSTWFQVGKSLRQDRGKLGSWPVGEMPLAIRQRIEGPNT